MGKVEVRAFGSLLPVVNDSDRRNDQMMILVLMCGLLPLPNDMPVVELGEIVMEGPRASDVPLEPMPEDKSLEELGYDE